MDSGKFWAKRHHDDDCCAPVSWVSRSKVDLGLRRKREDLGAIQLDSVRANTGVEWTKM